MINAFSFDVSLYGASVSASFWSPKFVDMLNSIPPSAIPGAMSGIPTLLHKQLPGYISYVTEVATDYICRECAELRKFPDYDIVHDALESALEVCVPTLIPEVIIIPERVSSGCVIEEIVVVKRATRRRKKRALRNNFYFEIPKYEREEKVPYVGKARQPYHVRRHERYLRRGKRIAKTIRRRTALAVKQLTEAIFSGVRRAALQSGKALHKQARAERDEEQRKAAAYKRKMRYKFIPKQQRKAFVKAQRDKRNAAHPDAFDSPEEHFDTEALSAELKRVSLRKGAKLQGGKVLPAMLGTLMGVLGAKLWRTLKKSDKVIQGASKFVEQLNGAVDSIKRHFGKMLWYVPVVMVGYFAIKHFSNLPAMSTALITTALSSILGHKVWDVISNFFPSGDVSLQAGAEPGVFAKLLTTIFTFSVFKRKLSASTTTEFVKRIAMFDRASAGWDTFLKWFTTALESLINFTRSFFGKERVTLIKKQQQHVLDWASRVDKIVCREATNGGDISPELLDEMVDVIRLGYEYRELYRGLSVARTIDDSLARIVTALAPYQGSLNARHNYRFEPAAAMFLGAPGIGKTLMAMPLCAAVMLESGLLSTPATYGDITKNVWQKGTSEYWNGYAGQTCLVIDDAFQGRADATDKENDYMSIIRMVSTWSMPLNFADLASKGKIYFGSKFIFGTTNLRSIDSEARIVLQEPGAVSRRINFPYELRVKQEYRLPSGMLNYDMFMSESRRSRENENPLDRFPWHIWEAAKHDFITGQSIDHWVPLREVVVSIAEDIKKRSSNFTTAKEALTDFISGYNEGGEEKAELQAGHALKRRRLNRVEPHRVDLVRPYEEPFEDVMRHELEEELPTFFELVKIAMTGFLVGLGCMFISFGTIAVLNFIWSVFMGFFQKKKSTTSVQSNRPLQPRTARQDKVLLQSVDSSVASNAYANTYKIIVETCLGPEIVGQIMFITSDLAVQPEHFSESLSRKLADGEVTADSTVTFRSVINSSFTFTMSVSKYMSFRRHSNKEGDVEFVQFQGVRAHRNIINNFMRESDLQHLSGYRGRLDVCHVDNGSEIIPHNHRVTYPLASLKIGTNLLAAGKKVSRYFKYEAPTDVGDCGAPLCVLDNSTFSGRTIIGFHIAGEKRRAWGFSAIVTQEMINEVRLKFDTVVDKFEEDLQSRGVILQSGHELPFTNKGSFLPIGTVDKPVTICPKSSYYMTDLYGAFGEYNYSPAPMSPVRRNGILVYPMEKAVEPYSSSVYIYEQPWLKQALHVAMRPLTLATRDMPRRLYTFDEAVLGIPEEKFRSIPRNTAAGFPYVYDLRDGKRSFFGTADEYDLTTPLCAELRGRVEHILESAKRGERLSHVFVDFLKDELRSAAKVEAVATRLISSAPLDYTIAWRMMFGAFSAAAMRVHTISGMAPGICTYTDWDILVSMLKKKGDKCFDGDFKAFDSSEQPCIHDLILDFINSWYDDGEDNARIRRVLWLDLTHSRHIGGLGSDQRHIYQWNKSLPSGHPFTTIVNSIYSLFLLVGSYISTTGNLSNFWTHVSSVTYGDDNVSNVSDEVSEVYNQRTVAAALKKEFNVQYTPGNKTNEYVDTMNLEDLTFLKRGFYRGDHSWLCPLDLDSFLYTCYWCKNRKLEAHIMIDVLENALLELSMHTEDKWHKYAPLVAAELYDRGHVTQAPVEQDQYLIVIRSRSDNWY